MGDVIQHDTAHRQHPQIFDNRDLAHLAHRVAEVAILERNEGVESARLVLLVAQTQQVIDTMLASMAAALDEAGRAGALGSMYGIQTFINLFIPSASAKAAVTMPIMAPFSDMIGVSRQATVLAFQFGDGFTNMITPCSGVLMAVLSVARIPYEKWFKWVWKFILALIVLGFILLLPTLWLDLPGF